MTPLQMASSHTKAAQSMEAKDNMSLQMVMEFKSQMLLEMEFGSFHILMFAALLDQSHLKKSLSLHLDLPTISFISYIFRHKVYSQKYWQLSLKFIHLNICIKLKKARKKYQRYSSITHPFNFLAKRYCQILINKSWIDFFIQISK